MKPTYALTEQRGSFLNTEFGRDYAMKIFGLTEPELEAIVGRYTKGKWKGELKGKITWTKCVRGGWYKHNGAGGVMRPGALHHAIIDPWTNDRQGGPKVLWSATFKPAGDSR